jgi:hypothetical protein
MLYRNTNILLLRSNLTCSKLDSGKVRKDIPELTPGGPTLLNSFEKRNDKLVPVHGLRDHILRSCDNRIWRFLRHCPNSNYHNTSSTMMVELLWRNIWMLNLAIVSGDLSSLVE